MASLTLDPVVDILLTQNAHDFYGVAVNSVTNTVHLDYLATIQAISDVDTGLNSDVAGYLRAWLWISENLTGSCWGFWLIPDPF